MKEKNIVRVLYLSLMLLPVSWFASSASSASASNGRSEREPENWSAHHRQKRLLWITNDGRIALPPGTIMTITPTIALPFVRYPPHGFLSNMTISLPFTIDFDKLGLTDNENPYGALPTAFDARARSDSDSDSDSDADAGAGADSNRSSRSESSSAPRQAGILMGDLVAAFLKARTRKRDLSEDILRRIFQAFHGGERALLYGTAEEILATFGLDGRACLLRAICEVHGHSLSNFGLVGEMLKLFFTASKSPFANLLNEYVQAEKRGKFHGECWPYFKDCPKSLFLPSNSNKYLKEADSGAGGPTVANHNDLDNGERTTSSISQSQQIPSTISLRNWERNHESRHSAM